MALAAATWGFLLRSTALATATAAIGSTMVFLTLAAYEGKPSGLFADRSIWGNNRWDAQARLGGPVDVFRFVDERVPQTAEIGLSGRLDYPFHPFFGPKLSRRLSFVAAGGPAPGTDWLVIGPRTDIRRCPEAWRPEFVGFGYRVERRVAPDACLEEQDEEVLAAKLDAP
jgi:hypothetical protein